MIKQRPKMPKDGLIENPLMYFQSVAKLYSIVFFFFFLLASSGKKAGDNLQVLSYRKQSLRVYFSGTKLLTLNVSFRYSLNVLFFGGQGPARS